MYKSNKILSNIIDALWKSIKVCWKKCVEVSFVFHLLNIGRVCCQALFWQRFKFGCKEIRGWLKMTESIIVEWIIVDFEPDPDRYQIILRLFSRICWTFPSENIFSSKTDMFWRLWQSMLSVILIMMILVLKFTSAKNHKLMSI